MHKGGCTVWNDEIVFRKNKSLFDIAGDGVKVRRIEQC